MTLKLMVRKSDGTLRRPGPAQRMFDLHGVNSGDLVIEHEGTIYDVGGLYAQSGIDFDPPTQYNYEASLFALEGRLFVRMITRQDDWEWRRNLESSDDGGRTWQRVDVEPSLEGWRLVDQVEGYG